MTVLDGFLILIGITIVLLCAMEGLLRSFIMLLAFYFIITGAGMVTLGTEALRGIAVTLSRATGGSGAPNMIVTQTVAFAGLVIPLFIGAYILSKMLFPEATIPKLKWVDNVLGLLTGIVLALIVMAVIYGTWGTAVSVQWHNRQAWTNMRFIYTYARLRPLMGRVLASLRPFLFLFAAIEYPPFFSLH